MFVTVTMRHSRKDELKDLLEVMNAAWRKVVSGSPWRRWKQELGLLGYVKALEITYGDANGWHPHFHFLFFVDDKPSEGLKNEFADFLFKRWTDKLLTLTDASHLPNREHGIDVQVADEDGKVLGIYVSKVMDIAAEISCADAKDGRRPEHYNPFQLLDITEPWAEARWREYVEASKGKRSIFFSPGLRDELGLNADTDDQTALQAELADGVHEVAGRISSEVYDGIVAHDRWVEFDHALRHMADGDWQAAADTLGVTLDATVDFATGECLPCLRE